MPVSVKFLLLFCIEFKTRKKKVKKKNHHWSEHSAWACTSKSYSADIGDVSHLLCTHFLGSDAAGSPVVTSQRRSGCLTGWILWARPYLDSWSFFSFFFFFSALVEKPVLWHTPWKHSGSLTLRIGKIQLFLFCFLRGVTIWDWENADPLKEWESWLVAPGLRPGLVWRRFVLLIISVGTFHLWGGRGVKTCILIHNQSVSTEKHSSIYQC